MKDRIRDTQSKLEKSKDLVGGWKLPFQQGKAKSGEFLIPLSESKYTTAVLNSHELQHIDCFITVGKPVIETTDRTH